MQTLTILEARELISFAEQTLAGLSLGESRLEAIAELGAERSWLGAGKQRVHAARERTLAVMARAGALPEFESERQAAGQVSFNAWVDSLEALLSSIVLNVSAGSPLIEVLFPHLKLDKLRSFGATARKYKTEFERRRSTSYVVRLASEPEYAFLLGPLLRVDAARAELASHEKPHGLTQTELDSLRAQIFASADVLRAALTQARLLAEAALIAHPDLLSELGLDAKPRKRSTRGAPGTADEPRA